MSQLGAITSFSRRYGGLVFDDDTEFLPLIRQQAMAALVEASVAIFVVDGQTGSTADETIAAWLRQQPTSAASCKQM